MSDPTDKVIETLGFDNVQSDCYSKHTSIGYIATSSTPTIQNEELATKILCNHAAYDIHHETTGVVVRLRVDSILDSEANDKMPFRGVIASEFRSENNGNIAVDPRIEDVQANVPPQSTYIRIVNLSSLDNHATFVTGDAISLEVVTADTDWTLLEWQDNMGWVAGDVSNSKPTKVTQIFSIYKASQDEQYSDCEVRPNGTPIVLSATESVLIVPGIGHNSIELSSVQNNHFTTDQLTGKPRSFEDIGSLYDNSIMDFPYYCLCYAVLQKSPLTSVLEAPRKYLSCRKPFDDYSDTSMTWREFYSENLTDTRQMTGGYMHQIPSEDWFWLQMYITTYQNIITTGSQICISSIDQGAQPEQPIGYVPLSFGRNGNNLFSSSRTLSAFPKWNFWLFGIANWNDGQPEFFPLGHPINLQTDEFLLWPRTDHWEKVFMDGSSKPLSLLCATKLPTSQDLHKLRNQNAALFHPISFVMSPEHIPPKCSSVGCQCCLHTATGKALSRSLKTHQGDRDGLLQAGTMMFTGPSEIETMIGEYNTAIVSFDEYDGLFVPTSIQWEITGDNILKSQVETSTTIEVEHWTAPSPGSKTPTIHFYFTQPGTYTVSCFVEGEEAQINAPPELVSGGFEVTWEVLAPKHSLYLASNLQNATLAPMEVITDRFLRFGDFSTTPETVGMEMEFRVGESPFNGLARITQLVSHVVIRTKADDSITTSTSNGEYKLDNQNPYHGTSQEKFGTSGNIIKIQANDSPGQNFAGDKKIDFQAWFKVYGRVRKNEANAIYATLAMGEWTAKMVAERTSLASFTITEFARTPTTTYQRFKDIYELCEWNDVQVNAGSDGQGISVPGTTKIIRSDEEQVLFLAPGFSSGEIEESLGRPLAENVEFEGQNYYQTFISLSKLNELLGVSEVIILPVSLRKGNFDTRPESQQKGRVLPITFKVRVAPFCYGVISDIEWEEIIRNDIGQSDSLLPDGDAADNFQFTDFGRTLYAQFQRKLLGIMYSSDSFWLEFAIAPTQQELENITAMLQTRFVRRVYADEMRIPPLPFDPTSPSSNPILLSSTRMIVKDKYSTVHRALVRDGWNVTRDSLYISYEGKDIKLDFEAERNHSKIAVKIKSFIGSTLSEFHLVLGQYYNYKRILRAKEQDRVLYFAIPADIWNAFQKSKFFIDGLQELQVKMIVYSRKNGEILKWIS
ncbi:MAG: element excision factor XisH family protein [Spirochaetota bacterium]